MLKIVLAVDGSASEARRWSLWGARTTGAWCALAAPQPGLAVQLFSLAAA